MQTNSGPIECSVTPWYFKRMALMGLMLLVFAALFFKDGAYSWPKEAQMAAEREDYQSNVLDAYDRARASGALTAWQNEARAKGIELNGQGEPLPWAAVAAKKGWPEKPKKRTPTEIEQQFYWGYGMLAGAGVVVVLVFLNRNKRLIGHEDHFITPEGRRVNHADAFRIDKRRWDNKGLATVHYRDESGTPRKADIDDLKYQGAARVLEALIANFKGEIIEKKAEPESTAKASS